MLAGLKKFFLSACDTLKMSPGSLEIIKTEGTSILSSQGDHWMQYGISNFEEIYRNIVQLIDMLEGYDNYADDSSQFMYDMMAMLDDLSFHASIFGLYFFSFESLFKNDTDGPGSHLLQQSREAEQLNIGNALKIATHWDSCLQIEERINWINRITSLCFQIRKCFETLFNDDLVDFSKTYLGLRQLYWHILTMQCLWKDAKQGSCCDLGQAIS